MERQEAERKAVLLEEQVGELQKEAGSAAADSAAALEAASLRSLQEIAAMKVWSILSHVILILSSSGDTAGEHRKGSVWMADSNDAKHEVSCLGMIKLLF